jgi:PAS domain S-box-containing protein
MGDTMLQKRDGFSGAGNGTGQLRVRAEKKSEENKRESDPFQAEFGDLIRSEDRYRTVVETANEGICITDPAGKCIFANKKMADMLGKSVEEMVGRPVQDFFGHDRDGSAPEIRVERETGHYPQRELKVVRKDGSTFWVILNATPIMDAQGRLLNTICMLTDISERKKREEELRKANRRKDEFLATLAHELRNPLAPIRNAAHIITSHPVKDPVLEQAAGIIERQVCHMAHLVDDLMDVSRIERGKIELQKCPLDFGKVVAHALEVLAPVIEERKHHVRVTLPDAVLTVDGDPVRLEQIVTNLLTNACKFTHAGGAITVKASREGDEVVLQVSDNGIGMAKETLGRIFEIFFQADNSFSRTLGGLGLGLMLVKQLTELHGGSITAASDGLGKGSRFTLKLPALEQQPAEETRVEEDTVYYTPGQPLHALVIDDNDSILFSTELLLKRWGFDVSCAADGETGVALALDKNPDVAIVDLGLPGMNGFEVAKELRKEFGTNVFLIALSGYSQESDRVKSAQAGFNMHLVKPINPKDLRRILSNNTPREA